MVSFNADEIRNKKVDVLHAVRPIHPDAVHQCVVRGQYGQGWVGGKNVPGYCEEEGVPPDSQAETFVALRLFLDNWRWQDVPFYLRTGKRLARQASEIAIQFRSVPHQSFPPEATLDWQPSRLTMSIHPDEGIVLRFQAKHPGPKMHLRSVEMKFNYRDTFAGRSPDAYETLLWDVMKNDATLLMRADQVEAAWRLLMPVLEVWAVAPPSDFPNYAAGTWGPEDTQGLLAQGHGWPLPTELVRQRRKKGREGVRDFVSTQLRKLDMRQKFVVGNWKMYTTAAEARQLTKTIVDGVGHEDRVSVAVYPPFPYLALVGEMLMGSRVALGAQNLFPEKEGAFTGEVSPTMLLDLRCTYVILGHSERRQMLGESDAFINQKVRVALAAGLDVILCIGETLDQRETDQTDAVLDRQLVQGLAGLSAETATRLSIAYEPVWAIGGHGHHATPQQAQESHIVIRRRFGQMFGKPSVQTLAILYGGSVKPENASALLSRYGVDGALIGSASLHADQFLAIVWAGISAPQTKGESA